MEETVYGAILEKGEKYYTYLGKVFQAINNVQRDYNWLISRPDCFPATPEFGDLLARKSCWLTGESLTAMIEREDFQWIWGVLSGFERDIPPEKVLEYGLPDPESPAFWKNPLTLQHPLASVEIAAHDSSLTLLLSRKKELVDAFRAHFPLSEDLAVYNKAYTENNEKGGTPPC